MRWNASKDIKQLLRISESESCFELNKTLATTNMNCKTECQIMNSYDFAHTNARPWWLPSFVGKSTKKHKKSRGGGW